MLSVRMKDALLSVRCFPKGFNSFFFLEYFISSGIVVNVVDLYRSFLTLLERPSFRASVTVGEDQWSWRGKYQG